MVLSKAEQFRIALVGPLSIFISVTNPRCQLLFSSFILRRPFDVGWNPNRLIFHERSGSRDEHKEHEEANKGKHGGNTIETLNQQEIVTHVLDP